MLIQAVTNSVLEKLFLFTGEAGNKNLYEFLVLWTASRLPYWKGRCFSTFQPSHL